MPTHATIDLETLSTKPDAVLLTIGAIKFDPFTTDPPLLILLLHYLFLWYTFGPGCCEHPPPHAAAEAAWKSRRIGHLLSKRAKVEAAAGRRAGVGVD